MAQPVWVTPAGSLGTIPEGVFYQIPLEAYEPELILTVTSLVATGSSVTLNFATQSTIPFLVGTTISVAGFNPTTYNAIYTVTGATTSSVTFASTVTSSVTNYGTVRVGVQFQVIAGSLPPGIQVEATGVIEGIPSATIEIQGVPAAVSRDVTSKFAIRAYTETIVNNVKVINRLADRTFTLTVTGQDAPEFTTPPGNIGTFYDGAQIEPIQIEYSDTDPADIVVIKLSAGQLPPGLTLSASGLISGYIIPNSPIDATAGFSRDGQTFDEYPFDFSTQSVDTTYEFVLEVTDGKSSDLRAFTIQVYSRDSLDASTTDITADNTFVTADASPTRVPFITTPQGSIGTVRNDNFFAFQFQGIDFDGDRFEFAALTTLPPGLTLDPISGWLYGYIPDLGQTENVYNFSLRVFKIDNPLVFSENYNYALSVIGTVDTTVTWLVPSDLGSINNGATSTLYVAAENAAGIPLLYRLKSGSDSSLPQGLTLLPSGDIAGRVSFNTFALDKGTTTFDVASRTGATTFDLTYTFVVNAYSTNGLVSVFKTFTIHLVRAYNEPYENLYIQAMPPFNDRAIINSLLTDSDIFPEDLLYRPTDPNFGLADNVIYQHAFGLTSSTIADYVSSLYLNHYWKNLVLGNIQTAQALDDDGNVLYEVVYSKIIDDLVNAQDQSVSKEVTLPYPIAFPDSAELSTVYPNSLDNMRDQVIDTVGQISNILPRWMLSKQANGQVLGFTPAWVIAYTQPGKSGQIAYNIETQFTQPLNLIDFKVDRYELDRALSINWDPLADSSQGSWEPTPTLTTFDINPHYRLMAQPTTGGTGYEVGDIISISGGDLLGVPGANDAFFTVAQVSDVGAIEIVFCSGTAELFTEGAVFINYFGTNIIGSGSGATFSIETIAGVQTEFDGGSLQFISPVDMYTTGNEYDKYLVFPKRNILE